MLCMDLANGFDAECHCFESDFTTMQLFFLVLSHVLIIVNHHGLNKTTYIVLPCII